jgi:2,3-bisphosphoglycerate-independent phosphoglycerate mutase
MPDHPTPLKKRVHTSDPVPFVIVRSGAGEDDPERGYSERAARGTSVYVDEGHRLIERLLTERA